MGWKPSIYDLKHNVPFRVFMAETLGMTIAVYVGISATVQVISGSYLYSSKAANLPWNFGGMPAAAVGNGLGLALAFCVCSKISGYHLNPASTLAHAVFGRTKWRLVPVYLGAQLSGALIASTIAFSVHVDAIDRYDTRQPYKSDAGFASYPVSSNASLPLLMWDQTWTAALYTIFLFGFSDPRGAVMNSGSNLEASFAIGAAFTLAMLTSSVNSGATANPTRDLSARLFTFVAQYGTDVWTRDRHFFWIPLAAPFPGALVGALMYQGVIAFFWPPLPPPAPSDREMALMGVIGQVRKLKHGLDREREEREREDDLDEVRNAGVNVGLDLGGLGGGARLPRAAGAASGIGLGQKGRFSSGIEINTNKV